jgi:hypothetical protein
MVKRHTEIASRQVQELLRVAWRLARLPKSFDRSFISAEHAQCDYRGVR